MEKTPEHFEAVIRDWTPTDNRVLAEILIEILRTLNAVQEGRWARMRRRWREFLSGPVP